MVAIGDYVKVGDAYGHVTNADDKEGVIYQTASGRYYTAAEDDMTVDTDAPFSSLFTGETPDILEILENVVVFAAIGKGAMKNPFFGKATMAFAVEDGLYELFLKRMFRKWGVEFLGNPSKDYPMSEGDFKSWGLTSEFYDSVNKTISLTIIDTAKRLFYKEAQLSKPRGFLVLQVLASLYLSNLGHRTFIAKDAKSYRRPQ